jgi:hypothetical protein
VRQKGPGFLIRDFRGVSVAGDHLRGRLNGHLPEIFGRVLAQSDSPRQAGVRVMRRSRPTSRTCPVEDGTGRLSLREAAAAADVSPAAMSRILRKGKKRTYSAE